jgi:peptidylprolyl isomerase
MSLVPKSVCSYASPLCRAPNTKRARNAYLLTTVLAAVACSSPKQQTPLPPPAQSAQRTAPESLLASSDAAVVHQSTTTAAPAALDPSPERPDPTPPDPRLLAPPDVHEPPPDAVKTKSGLRYKILSKGHGHERPRLRDVVEVEFTAWTSEGHMFNTTIGRNKASELPVAHVIPGWRESLLAMHPGETRRLWVHQNLALEGLAGMPTGPLVFDLKLLEIEGKEESRSFR